LWHNLARRQNAGELTPPPAVVLPVRWAVINVILFCYIYNAFFSVVSCRHVVFPVVCERPGTRLISISRTPSAAKSRFIFFQCDVHMHVNNNLYLYNVYKTHIRVMRIYIYNIVSGMMCSVAEWRRKMTTCKMRQRWSSFLFTTAALQLINYDGYFVLFGQTTIIIIITYYCTVLEPYGISIFFSGTWNYSILSYKLISYYNRILETNIWRAFFHIAVVNVFIISIYFYVATVWWNYILMFFPNIYKWSCVTFLTEAPFYTIKSAIQRLKHNTQKKIHVLHVRVKLSS